MQAWDGPDVPRLPGRGLPLRLYDTATDEVRPTAVGSTARMYVCGITPYDATHLGHAMTYTVFDVVQRAWRDAGHDVVYTQNVTDVDDPLLERAVATGDDWRELAERETAVFRSDMAALRVIAPQHYVGAVESVPLICERIAELQQRGATYVVDGDLYLDLAMDESFGSVSSLDRHTMAALCAQRGGDPGRPGKRGPLDPLLWQAARPDEPAWDTRLGHGRPGWHIECVAIALQHLGMGFDVQGGGRDLVFPHHEMCAATARLLTGEPVFARHYAHVGMVALHGEKMSKSRGNLVFVRDLRRTADPAAIRLALLARHYRADWEWTDADLAEAQQRLARWRAALAAPAGPDAERLLARLRDRISDDLDTPAALRAIDEWAGSVAAGIGSDPGAPALVRSAADALLGVRVD